MTYRATRNDLSRLAIASAVYMALFLGSLAWARVADHVAEAWFANAFLVALLLRKDLRFLRLTLASGFLAVTVCNLLVGASIVPSLGYAVANMAEVAVAVWLARRLGLGSKLMLGERFFAVGILTTIVAAPMVAAACGATLATWLHHAPWTRVFVNWWLGGSVGMLMLLPPMLAYDGPRMRRLVSGDRAALFWTVVPFSLAVTYLSATHLSNPFIVWSIPLLFMAYRLGVLGTALACSLNIITVYALAAAQANGWLTDVTGLAHLDEAGLVLFSSLSITGPILIAIIMAQRASITEDLAQASTRLKIVADNIPGLVGQLDLHGRYVFVNRRYLEWFDLAEVDMIGKTPREVFGPQIGDVMSPYIRDVLAGKAQQFELGMPNGQRMHVHYEPEIRDNRVEGFFVLTQDITDRKELEARLREITDNVPALIAYLDDTLVYRFANGRYLQMWNLNPKEVIGRTSADVAGPEYTELLHPRQLECLAGKRANVEVERDGRIFELTYIPHFVDGRVCGMYKLGVDVTARKQAEGALFESMERARMMLQSIGDAVVACDRRMCVTMMNPIAEDMTGWEEKDALGRPFEEVVRLVDMESGGTAINPLRIAIQENRIVALQADCALRRRDDMETPIEDSASPILDRDGNVAGGIMVFHDVSEARAMALKMSHLAQHDYLTDLPNRVLLHDRLSHALDSLPPGRQGALLYIDLDHFKNINDSLGHPAGDHVLREIARRLRQSVRSDDTVSRQGGDEFVVLLNRLGDPRDAARIADKIIRAIEQPVEYEGRKLHVSACVGISMFPQDSTQARELMKQADTALYHAKQTGRARFSYFTQSMSIRAEERLSTEHAMRRALQQDELFVAYQPKVLWPEGQVIGAEALVRWKRASGTIVPPDEFIHLAEETGLITQVDEWVMRKVCRQIAQWRAQGLETGPISVNVSLARLDNDRLVENTRRALASNGIPAECLEIEFTESQMFAHKDQTVELISRLKELGVGLAVDDFGTGYSSLSYLAQYDFDIIKIDRTFIQGLPDNARKFAIVKAIIGMAQALGYRLIAEGVETTEEASTLQRHGCQEMQGFLFSQPITPEACGELFRSCAPIRIDGPRDARVTLIGN